VPHGVRRFLLDRRVRGQRPRRIFAFLLWETFALTVPASAALAFAMRAYPQCDAAPAAASSRLLHSVAEPAPRRVTPDPLCRPGAGTGSRTALPLEEACTPSRSHPERGCRLLGKGKNLWRFSSVFLPWRAMRLTDISKCLFPECCDETKPALTGTCSLFPSWSLICHC